MAEREGWKAAVLKSASYAHFIGVYHVANYCCRCLLPAIFCGGPGGRTKAPTKNSDDQIIETYLEHRRIGGYNASEARAVWQLYKQMTDSKPLKDADRDDGRKLVKHFMDKGLKSATIEKKIAWLNAAVNLAIKESKLKFNPFAGIIPRL